MVGRIILLLKTGVRVLHGELETMLKMTI